MNPSPTSTRRRGRKFRLGAVTLAAFSLVAAACGDDGDEASTATDAPSAESSDDMSSDDMSSETSDDMSDDMSDDDMSSDMSSDMSDDMSSDTGGDMAEGPFGPACSAVPADGEGSFDGMADDPAATAASNNPVLSTLVTAVSEAGLVDTLNGDGPFTIFAPTNDAFAAIPEDDLNAVLADTELLTSILTYHVVAGQSLDAEGLASAGELETVNGGTITFGSDGTTVNDATVVCSDVTTANATVHIIDTVLMPAADEMSEDMSGDEMSEDMSSDMSDDMSDGQALAPSGAACSAVPADGEGSFDGMADDPAATAASNNPVLSTLVTAVSEAGLVDTLNGEGPFTIFAPINDAFAAIPEDDLNAVLADTELLTSILTYHVVAGEQLSSAQLIEAGTVTTVNGADLTITDAEGTLTVNDASSVCMDVPTANATVHLIDAVLMP